jgi:uncharacterized membrane protein (UPF0127 family)
MIFNKTKNKILIRKEKYCRNIFSQAWGLMFSRRRNLMMEFSEERKIRLHNCFVFYPIDVLVLDKDQRIVEIKRNLKPFAFWNAKRKGKYVVELGVDRDKVRKDYRLGDLLLFRPPPKRYR